MPIEAANLLVPGKMKIVGPAVDLAALRGYLAKVMERAEKVGMKTVVTSGSRRRFISAIWNSLSKSDTARSPRTITRAPTCRAKSMVRPLKVLTSTPLRSPRLSRIMATRSPVVNSGCLLGFSRTAMTTRSKIPAARSTMSR